MNDPVKQTLDNLRKRAGTEGEPLSKAKERINRKRTAGGDETIARVLDDEFKRLGYGPTARLSILGDIGRENGYNRNTIFGGHADPKNREFNRGIISWQKDRRVKLDNFLKKKGH